MANLGGTFNPDDIPQDEFEPIPAGEYLAQIIDSEIAPTKSGSGQMLKLTFEITQGELEGRRVWDRLNIVNANADAQRIAQQQLKRLCDALGTGAIADSEELHFRPVIIHVAIRQDKSGDYGPQNVIRKFSPAGALPERKVAPQPQKAAPPPKGGNRPWQQRATT